jgi:O-antigen/teichoic acid export membrane protein
MNAGVTMRLPGKTTPGFVSSFPAESLRGRFARSAGWALAGAITSSGLGLIASVVSARLLGSEAFGALGMIQTTVGTCGILAGAGLGMTATKSVAELRATDPERAGRIIGLGWVVAAVMGGLTSVLLYVFAPFLAAATLNAPALAAELRIGAGFLFLNALIGMQTGVLAGFEAFKALAFVNLWRGLASFPLAIAGVLLWRLPGAVWALSAGAAVGLWLNHMALRQACRQAGVRVRVKGGWAERSILWNFSIPAFLGSAVAGPATWAASAMLVNQPNGYAEMGIFSAANQWRTAVNFIPSTLSQPLLAMLSSMYGNGAMRSYRKLVWANLWFTFCITAAIAAGIGVGAPLVAGAYGPGFAHLKPVLILVMTAAVISATAGVIGQMMASAARMWAGFTLNGVWVFALLSSAHALVPRFGAAGLAGASLAAYVVHALTVSVYTGIQFTGGTGPVPAGPCVKASERPRPLDKHVYSD